MNFRYLGFWALDRFLGGKTARQWQDIAEHFNLPIEEAAARNKKRINELLSHASNSVPFYHRLRGNLDLQAWPIVDKTTIRENQSDFLSNAFSRNQLTKVVTSGSTGTPFEVFHDQRKRRRNTSDTMYFAELAGFQLGDELFYLKVWNNLNKKSPLTHTLQNIRAWDVKNLADADISRLLAILQSTQGRKGLLGYASAYDAICSYCMRHSIDVLPCNVCSIIAMSERLDEGTRQQMTSLFGCPTLSRYSNVENGILAQQLRSDTPQFKINSASFHIEILDLDSNSSTLPGEMGRIVITDLFNYAMPMIRYDTGDTGRFETDPLTSQQMLAAVEGRRMDLVYNTKGELVSSFTITNNMWKYSEIRQYQFVQNSKYSYTFILNTQLPFFREAKLVHEFKGYFGQDAQITVEYVSEIPLLASGKRKKVRSELPQP